MEGNFSPHLGNITKENKLYKGLNYCLTIKFE